MPRPRDKEGRTRLASSSKRQRCTPGLLSHARSFVFLVNMLSLHLFILCVYQLSMEAKSSSEQSNGDRLTEAIHRFPFLLVMAIYTAIVFLTVVGLAIYHCTLICSGQTTNEQIRGKYRDRPNPNDKGWIGNWSHVFFSPIPPSELTSLVDVVS